MMEMEVEARQDCYKVLFPLYKISFSHVVLLGAFLGHCSASPLFVTCGILVLFRTVF